MHLNFGPIKIDTKGLPRIFQISVDPSYPGERTTRVSILLSGDRRADVQRWAARLGVEVSERETRPLFPGDRWARRAEAVAEVPGFRVTVWTRIAPQASAAAQVSS